MENLKAHYKQDLKVIENYWRKFDVCGTFDMDTFYNQHIVIKDKYKLLKSPVKSFDDLFATDYRHYTIVADAGYGKSTFAHEIAHQWVKGDKPWTKRINFLFLFRLTEVSLKEAKSLQTLLTKCLCINDSIDVKQWLNEATWMEKALFIFDGLDELQHEFCEEIENIIFCKSNKLAQVVLTSRPCKKLSELGSTNLYVELSGYTDEGVESQLKKFSINPLTIRKDLRNILKVPLFNTLFCITHDETAFGCLNICIAIERFVQFTCNRYRKTDSHFTKLCEHNLLLMLGKSAQNKFSFMKNADIEHPEVTHQQLHIAASTGLVFQKSTLEDFIFAHQTIAEYCAAYFWVKTSPLKVDEIRRYGNVYFVEPQGGSLKHNDLFSRFLCHLNFDYKLFLWKNFEHHAPLLDEYESLPKRRLKDNKISFAFLPIADQISIMNKIDFETDTTFQLYDARFEKENVFENLTEIENLQLVQCSFKIDPVVFFQTYNLKSLFFNSCTFKDDKMSDDDLNEPTNTSPNLEYLKVSSCEYTINKFLTYIMRCCKSLKTFKLLMSFENNSQNKTPNCWIKELQNNQQLLYSIEHFQLECGDPYDLTLLFKVLQKFVGLKKIGIWIKKRRISESEVNALTASVGNKLKCLEDAKIDLTDEQDKKWFI